MDTIHDDIVATIIAERRYQDSKWGGADNDDNHPPSEWIRFIHEYAKGHTERAARHNFGVRIVKCAALALAAIEREDRETVERSAIDQVAIIDEATSTMTIADDITAKTFQSTLIINLLKHAGSGQETPKMFRANMLVVIAYCLRVLRMLSEAKAAQGEV